LKSKQWLPMGRDSKSSSATAVATGSTTTTKQPSAGTFPAMVTFDHYLLTMCGGTEVGFSGEAHICNLLTGEWKLYYQLCNREFIDGIGLAITSTSSPSDTLDLYLYGGFSGVPRDTFMKVELNWNKEARELLHVKTI